MMDETPVLLSVCVTLFLILQGAKRHEKYKCIQTSFKFFDYLLGIT